MKRFSFKLHIHNTAEPTQKWDRFSLQEVFCTSRPCCSLKSRLRVRFVSKNVSNFCSSSSCWRPNWSECVFDCFLSWIHKVHAFFYSHKKILEVIAEFGVWPPSYLLKFAHGFPQNFHLFSCGLTIYLSLHQFPQQCFHLLVRRSCFWSKSHFKVSIMSGQVKSSPLFI